MGFYAVISNSNGNARVIVITCHSPALLISSAGASIANLKQETNSLNSLCNSAKVHGSQKLCCVCVRARVSLVWLRMPADNFGVIEKF